MMKLALLSSSLALFLTAVNAATKVAVIELGKEGAVRRTTSSNASTVGGVNSFWSALHSPKRSLQYPDMPMVPDIFRKPDAGIVIGISGSGMDLDNLPKISALCSEEGHHGVVGHMELPGERMDELMGRLTNVEDVDESSLSYTLKEHSFDTSFRSMRTSLDTSAATRFDKELGSILEKLGQQATEQGKSVVVHLVVEEEEGSSRRRALARRLNEGEDGEGEEGSHDDEDEDKNSGDEKEGDENDENDAEGGNDNRQEYNGYYGFGYYNAYGEWVSQYKSMFQIQYFNVVLWTSVGLGIVLIYTVYLMVYMPLMPDTLLFGESAKLVGDE